MPKPDPQNSPLSEPLVKQLAANIRALRMAGGWTVRSLAQECRVVLSTAHLLEHALHGAPSLKTVDTIARVLGVDTGSMLGPAPSARVRSRRSISRILGGNLVAARKSLKLSQQALSELAGVSRVQIARIEVDERNPTIDTLARLAAALGTTVEMLLTPRRPSDWLK